MAHVVRTLLDVIRIEVVLVVDDGVVRGFNVPFNPCMCLKIKVVVKTVVAK
jgi:hypothetical protein